MLWLLLYIGVIFCLVVKCVVVVYVYWCDLLFVVKCAVVVYVYWCELLL